MFIYRKLRPAGTLDKPSISQRRIAQFAEETVRMPAAVHRLNHTTDYELL